MANGKGLKEKLEEFVKDVATLDVITLTGDIGAIVDGAAAPGGGAAAGPIDLNAVAQKILSNTRGSAQYVAFTHYEFDCDSVSFFSSGAASPLMNAHNETVKAAMEARRGMIQLAGTFIGSLIKI